MNDYFIPDLPSQCHIRPIRLCINELRRDNKTNRTVTTVTQSACVIVVTVAIF